MPRILAALLLSSLAGLAGCAPSGPERARVSGSVRLDGKPVEKGTINFFPAAGKAPTAGGVIVNGAYDIERANGVVVGDHEVKINANRKTGRQVPNAMGAGLVDDVEEAIPSKYNTRTTLSRTVVSGHNVLDFDLESK